MNLFITANTHIPELIIDYIEVRLASGKTVTLSWDTSEICHTTIGFISRYCGIYFDEEYANGMLSELKDMVITDIGLYSESDEPLSLSITRLEFWDDGKILVFVPPKVEEGVELSAGSKQAPQGAY